ncbi:MAG: hypothetical protein JNM09_10110 [Blastocatellia bacterium]|nr:hypothetical protein [Blastocatellia bacterium]
MLSSNAFDGVGQKPLLCDALTADRQLHFICEGWKKGFDFDGLRQLVEQFYGSDVKPCQLHWTEVDRLIIEIWRQDIRKDLDHLWS